MVIFGAGGHASDVLAVIEALNARSPSFAVAGLVADDVPKPDRFSGRRARHLGSLAACRASIGDFDAGVLAVGYPEPRQHVWRQLQETSIVFPRLIHPDATLEAGVDLGTGVVVLAGARLSSHVSSGNHTSFGHQVVVGHDVEVGHFSVLMPSATISGDVQIGDGVLIGTNATILEGVRIGSNARVGAGAVVLHDVRPRATVVGVPSHEISQRCST